MNQREYKLARTPNPAGMTVQAGEIEQRLPPKRRTPSLPAVTLEGKVRHRAQPDLGTSNSTPPGARKLTPTEQERWLGDQRDVGLQTDGHRVWIQENTDVGAGATRHGKRPRVLTTVEAMYRLGTIDREQWEAARALCEKLLRQLGHTEGVGTYGQHPGGSDPAERSDRRGRALSGYAINTNTGHVQAVPRAMASARRNRNERVETAQLLFAATGVETTEGEKVYDIARTIALILAVVGTTKPPTLAELAARLTPRYEGSKQKTAAAAAALREMLQRMSLHLGLKKGAAWDDRALDALVRNVKV